MHRLTLLLALGLIAAACLADEADPPTIAVATTTKTTLPATTTTAPTTTTTTLPPTPTTIPKEPAIDASAPRADSSLPTATEGAAVVALGGADLYRETDGEPYVRAHEGLLFPIVGRDGEWLELLDHCDDPGWVRFDEVAFTPARDDTPPVGEGFDFADATIVVDPGHGGPNVGAVGPTGLVEKEVNLDIARRTRDLLNAPHAIDWETGEILNGSAIPPAGEVWVTRPEGPEGADIETGLTFRAAIANSVRAHALVSIHNNAAPDGPYDGPGSEVYHQVTDLRSKRLSGLIVEEMRRGFSAFEADWVGDDEAGAKVRVKENGQDIYGILRLSDVPAVIAEGVFISNASEEALLRTPEFRQAYADAVYRALVRFITTLDLGSGYIDTEPFTAGGLSSGAPVRTCTVPAQPDE